MALSGCMTPAKSVTPGEVPASRIHIKEMAVSTAGQNQVTVTRDPSEMGRLMKGLLS